MKNIAQFVRLAAEQLDEVKPEHEAGLLNTLRAAMPSVLVRAEHILGAVSRQTIKVKKCKWRLAEVWQQAVDMHSLKAKIQGTATAFVDKETLRSIIDNLTVNYVDQARLNHDTPPRLEIHLSQEQDKSTATIQDVQGRPCLWPERLFEPFWSEQSNGMGIGLYQARQLAVAAGGSLEVRAASSQPLIFVLTLPRTEGEDVSVNPDMPEMGFGGEGTGCKKNLHLVS